MVFAQRYESVAALQSKQHLTALIIMTYTRYESADRSFWPVVAAYSNVKFGFSHDFATHDDWPLSSTLCNLATVSKCIFFLTAANYKFQLQHVIVLPSIGLP